MSASAASDTPATAVSARWRTCEEGGSAPAWPWKEAASTRHEATTFRRIPPLPIRPKRRRLTTIPTKPLLTPPPCQTAPHMSGMSDPMRVGVLTGGGDCPGLNAAIRAVVRSGIARGGFQFVGFRDGWAGLLNDEARELTLQSTAGILPRGGTILGTSRTNPYAGEANGTAMVRETLR